MSKMLEIWKPIINCGFNAGDTPMFWDNNFSSFQGFRSEEDCQEWIDNNQENFTESELGCCVFPTNFKVETPTFLDSDGIPILVYDDDVYDNILEEMNGVIKDYALDGVELTHEDASSVIRLFLHGKSIDEAIAEVMMGIRQTLDEGLDDYDDDDDYDPSKMTWDEIKRYVEEKDTHNWYHIMHDTDWSYVHCEEEIDDKIDEWYDMAKTMERCKN